MIAQRLWTLGGIVALCMQTTVVSWGQTGTDKLTVTESPKRTWTSRDGRFKVEGMLVEIFEKKVFLSGDGKRVTVAIDQLSDADQRFVASERKRIEGASPFVEAAPESAPKPENSESKTVPPPKKNPSAALSKPDRSKSKVIVLNSKTILDEDSPRWQPVAGPSGVQPFQIEVSSIHVSAQNFGATPDARFFFVSFRDPFGRPLSAEKIERDHERQQRHEKTMESQRQQMEKFIENLPESRRELFRKADQAREKVDPEDSDAKNPSRWVEVYQLENANLIGKFELPSDEAVVGDLSPDGKTVLVYSDSMGEDTISLMEIGSDALAPVKSWNVGGMGTVQSARFLDSERVVVERSNQVTVLKLNPLSEIFRMEKSITEPIRLCSDRRHALVVNREGRRFEVDLVDGVCTAASPPLIKSGITAVAKGSGMVAEYKSHELSLSDKTKQNIDQFYIPVYWPNVTVRWLDDRFLQINDPSSDHYVDVKNRVLLLNSRRSAFAKSRDGLSVRKELDPGAYTFIVSPVENQTAVDLLKTLNDLAEQLPAQGDELLILQPGARVKLTMKFSAEQDRANGVLNSLRQLLKDRGLTEVSSGGDYEIVAESSVHSRQETFQYIGEFRTETVNLTTQHRAISILKNDKVVHIQSGSSGSGFMGGVLWVEPGQSAQQAIDQNKRSNERFWDSVRLPDRMAEHPNGGAWFSYDRESGSISGPN